MTEPEDRESKSSTPKPPDTLGGNLPPRLREKLMEAAEKDSGDGMGKSPVVGLTLAVLVIAAVVGFVWWLIHSDQVKKAAEAARAAASARAIAVADSLDAVARADSLAAAARADSIAFAALPKSQQRKILAERAKKAAAAAGSAASSTPPAASTSASASASAPTPTAAKPAAPAAAAATPGAKPSEPTAAEPAAPKEKGPFAIDAGNFLDQAQANGVAEALKVKAKLPVQVVSMGEGGDAQFHVLVGSFSTHSAADAAANKLFAAGTVEQAVVVPIPKTP